METTVSKANLMFTVGEISEILGSALEGDVEFRLTPLTGIEIDSRKVAKGGLFVAVKGERFNGHDFLDQAFARGAIAVVISKTETADKEMRREHCIVVDDTVYALGELARAYRNRFDLKVIAVTGSNGKTTVKNLIYEILSKNSLALKSEKNYNNFFGLPLSIFKLTDRHKSAVFELGMSAPGEIARLSEIAAPDVAVITNVGPVHLEFFENVERIAKAKLEIQQGIREGGTLIINGDDNLLRENIGDRQKIITFGIGCGNDVHPENLGFDKFQNPSFTIDGIKFSSKLPGIHNVYNLLAAVTVAKTLGIDPALSAEAIAEYMASDLRSEIVKKDDITYIVDCYNANPVSMKYALDTLAAMKCDGRRIAVLGDMLELGKSSDDYHYEIGKYAKDKCIDMLFCHGPLSSMIAAGFGDKASYVDSKDELTRKLAEYVKPGDLVLFKASRGIALEEIVDKILGDE
ncbi:MAG: UDP-N-acetylmuramoyl-tripeptide--D-alanyl-D-alanine ligase [candidate division Zixibacteria bacterium]